MGKEPQAHRAGKLKQSNKAFKGESKNAFRKAVGTAEVHRVSIKVPKIPNMKAHNLNQARQKQELKRQETLAKKRLGSRHGPPKLVGIIPISPDVNLEDIAIKLGKECKPSPYLPNTLPFIQTMSSEVEKREGRFTFMVAPRDPIAVADIAKVADVVLLVMAPKDESDDLNVDNLGNHFIQLLKAQGLPGVIGVTQGVSKLSPKKQPIVNKLANRFFTTVFGDDCKVVPLDDERDTQALLRWSFHASPREVTWRQERPRLLGEHIAYTLNKDYAVASQAQATNDEVLYNMELGTLKVSGFLRGEYSLSANQLVHITGFGDFQVISIEGQKDDNAYSHLKKGEKPPTPVMLSVCDNSRESMQDLIDVNGLNHEQGVITDEELLEAIQNNPQLEGTSDMFTRNEQGELTLTSKTNTTSNAVFNDWKSQNLSNIKSLSAFSSGTVVMEQGATVLNEDVVAGMKHQDDAGIIQSVWDELELDDDDNQSITGMDDEGMSITAAKTQKKALKKEVDMEEGIEIDNLSNLSNLSGFSMGTLRNGAKTSAEVVARFADLPYKEKVSRLMKYGTKGEDRLTKEKRKMEKNELQGHADEVEFDPSITARARFSRYRGLKSFKYSAWDHNENLPLEYSQIYQFANFDVSMRNAKDACTIGLDDDSMEDEMLGGAAVNPERATPITITIANVTPQMASMLLQGRAFALVWGLFRHERKVTVLHTLVKRHPEYDLPIKGKDPMHVQIGFRRFTVAPIYSKPVNGTDKTLVQRFFPKDDKFYMASFYGRVTFPQATVLMFPAHVLGSYKAEFPFNPLAASGNLVSCNPNKVVLKRAVLTGFPFTVSKSHAVVRHMFYNASDVKWFKPVELWTKNGRHGHILESRGLHGLFKCQFDNTLKEKEAICMSLYKRQFPPWNPSYLG